MDKKNGIIIVGVIAFIITNIIIYPLYGINDELFQEVLCAGLFNSEPTPFIIFSNYYLGLLLTWLYKLIPSIPWYALILNFITLVSSLLIFISINDRYKNNSKHIRYFILLCFLLLLVLPLLQSIYFTTIAGLATIAGMFYLSGNSFASSKIKSIAAVLLILLGSMIRFDSALLCIFLFGAGYIFKVNRNTLKRVVIFEIIAAGLLAGVITLEYINRHQYNSNESWHGYLNFNKYRAYISDYSLTSRLTDNDFSDIEKHTGLTKNDLYLIKDFNHYTKNSIDYKNFKYISKKAGNYNTVILLKFKDAFTDFIKNFIMRSKKFLILLVLLFIVFRYSKRNVVTLGLNVLLVFSTYIIIFIFLRPPPYRVYYLFQIYLALAIIDIGEAREFFTKLQGKTISALSVVSISIVIFGYINGRAERVKNDYITTRYISWLNKTNYKYSVYLSGGLYYERISPYSMTVKREIISDNSILPSSYLLTTPSFNDIINKGIPFTSGNVLFIISPEHINHAIPRIIKFYEEKYSWNNAFPEIVYKNDFFILLKMKK